MNKEVLERLIIKFLSGKISPQERIDLEKWYSSFETDEGYLINLSNPEIEELGNKLLGNIDQTINSPEKTTGGREMVQPAQINKSQVIHWKRPLFSYSYKIAAVFLGLIILSALTYKLLQDSTEVHTTAYGQTLQITLPDGSIVVLNGNSSIRHASRWANNESREVFLDGEAYFSIRHTEQDQKFMVNTSDRFNVEVLGTEFTVSKRKSGTRVVLNSGKVLLNILNTKGDDQVIMKPGELIEFKEGAGNYTMKKVNAEVYSSWKDKKLILDHTSLREILIMLRDNYGLKVTHVDNELLDQKVSGSMPEENIDMLLKDIAVTYGIKITKTNNTLEVRKKTKPEVSDN